MCASFGTRPTTAEHVRCRTGRGVGARTSESAASLASDVTPLGHDRLMCDTDDLAPLNAFGRVAPGTPHGSVVDRWPCPGCERIVDIVHRPGRPRIYCSQACRQRVYRWRRRHGAHTEASPAWPVECASARSNRLTSHALRSERDPLSRRRDRRGRELTVCGLLARPGRRHRQEGLKPPFLPVGDVCRVCTALIAPRPLGLVPPGSMPPPYQPSDRLGEEIVERFRAIDEAWPLDPAIRGLLTTVWKPYERRPHTAGPGAGPGTTRRSEGGRTSQAA